MIPVDRAREISRATAEAIRSLLSCHPDSVIGNLVRLNANGTGDVEVNGFGQNFTYPEAPFTDSRVAIPENVGKAVVLVFLDRSRQVYQILCLAMVLAFEGEPPPEPPPLLWPERYGVHTGGTHFAGAGEVPPAAAVVDVEQEAWRYRCLRVEKEALWTLAQDAAGAGGWSVVRRDAEGNRVATPLPTLQAEFGTQITEVSLLEDSNSRTCLIAQEGPFFFTGPDAKVVKVNAADASVAWSTDLDNTTHGSPTAKGQQIAGKIYVPTAIQPPLEDYKLGIVALATDTGEILSNHEVTWETPAPQCPQANEVDGGLILSFPLADDGYMIGPGFSAAAPGEFNSYGYDSLLWRNNTFIPRVQGGEQLVCWDPVTASPKWRVLGWELMSGLTGTYRRFHPLTFVGPSDGERDQLLSAFETLKFQETHRVKTAGEVDPQLLQDYFDKFGEWNGRVFIDQANYDKYAATGEFPPEAGFEEVYGSPDGKIDEIIAELSGLYELFGAPAEATEPVTNAFLTDNDCGWELRNAENGELNLQRPLNQVYATETQTFAEGEPSVHTTLTNYPAAEESGYPTGVAVQGGQWVSKVKVRAYWPDGMGGTDELFYWAFTGGSAGTPQAPQYPAISYGFWPTDTQFEAVAGSAMTVFRVVYPDSVQITFTQKKYAAHSMTSGVYSPQDNRYFFHPARRLQGTELGDGAVWFPIPAGGTTPSGEALPDAWINDHTYAAAFAALDCSTLETLWNKAFPPFPWLNYDPDYMLIGGFEMAAVDLGEERGFLANCFTFGASTPANYNCLLRVDRAGNLMSTLPHVELQWNGLGGTDGDNLPYMGGHVYAATNTGGSDGPSKIVRLE